jgi:protein-tyrosine phosphatase
VTWQFQSKMAACYHEPKKIFEHDGISYYAADEDGAEEFRGGLVLNLTAQPHIVPSHNIPELRDHFDIGFDEIMIPCPDYGLPKVRASFWEAIHTYAANKGYADVCIHCVGGHGRTGTVLCAMMIANKGMTMRRAITKVRTKYCKYAVESDGQVEYLRELDYLLNGRKISDRDGIQGSSHLVKDLDQFNF